MSSASTYLITGANRGIGQGSVRRLLLRPGCTVIAAVRDPSKAIVGLEALPTGEESRLLVVKVDSTVHTDAAEAAEELRQKHGIDKVDVVIANAGIYQNNTSILNTDPDLLREHFEVNTLAPLALLRAFAPLLKGSVAPKFVGISSLVGGLGLMKEMMEYGNVASPYGASKAALNWIVQRVCLEEDWLTAFVFNPGLVITDMAKSFAGGADLEKIGGSTVDDSTESMLKIIDVATRDVHGGKFLQYNGQELPWPLLQASGTGNPVFVAISSLAGSIASQAQLATLGLDLAPYGASKAALNWFVHRAHFEETWLTAVALHPGHVLSRMGAPAGDAVDAKTYGALTPDESARDMFKIIDGATRESVGGKFLQWDGAGVPW